MHIVKLISLALLAIYLIFTALAGLFDYHISGFARDLLGFCGVLSGILMLISVREFCCCSCCGSTCGCCCEK